MSVKTAPMFWVECDGCGRRPEEDSTEILSDTREDAIDYALGGDFYRVGRYQHACWDCIGWDGNDKPFIKPRPLSHDAGREEDS